MTDEERVNELLSRWRQNPYPIQNFTVQTVTSTLGEPRPHRSVVQALLDQNSGLLRVEIPLCPHLHQAEPVPTGHLAPEDLDLGCVLCGEEYLVRDEWLHAYQFAAPVAKGGEGSC